MFLMSVHLFLCQNGIWLPVNAPCSTESIRQLWQTCHDVFFQGHVGGGDHCEAVHWLHESAGQRHRQREGRTHQLQPAVDCKHGISSSSVQRCRVELGLQFSVSSSDWKAQNSFHLDICSFNLAHFYSFTKSSCTLPDTCMHICTHACICKHACTHTHTHTHTHTCTHTEAKWLN